MKRVNYTDSANLSTYWCYKQYYIVCVMINNAVITYVCKCFDKRPVLYCSWYIASFCFILFACQNLEGLLRFLWQWDTYRLVLRHTWCISFIFKCVIPRSSSWHVSWLSKLGQLQGLTENLTIFSVDGQRLNKCVMFSSSLMKNVHILLATIFIWKLELLFPRFCRLFYTWQSDVCILIIMNTRALRFFNHYLHIIKSILFD